MSRINVVESASGKAKELLDTVQRTFGGTPNLFRVIAQSPAALEGLLGLLGGLAKSTLSGKTRTQIALAVAQANGCDYCLSAHTLIGKSSGLSDAEINQAYEGHSSDPKTEAILRLALAIVVRRGHITNSEFSAATAAGLTQAELVETVAVTVLNIFTNYMNFAAETEIDFPVVHSRALAA